MKEKYLSDVVFTRPKIIIQCTKCYKEEYVYNNTINHFLDKGWLIIPKNVLCPLCKLNEIL